MSSGAGKRNTLWAPLQVLLGVCILALNNSAWSEEVVLFGGLEDAGAASVLRVEDGALTASDGFIEARFKDGSSGTVALNLSDTLVDWTGYEGVSFDIENFDSKTVALQIAVESRDEAGRAVHARRTVRIAAGERMQLPFFFTNGNAGPYWGMRGIPIYHRLSHVAFANPIANIHLARIARVALEPDTSSGDVALRIYQATLFKLDSALSRLVPHPFIDAYGQFIHGDWPGKVHDDGDLAAALAEERREFQEAPRLPGFDAMGGWQDGPQLEATGWFRVEKINGRWWFVTPEGRLFLSIGVNCVHYGDSTFIEGRDGWFAGLPETDGDFAPFWGHVSGVHSMADPVGGQGRVFNHYGSNLFRKFGSEYVAQARTLAYDRLRAWGFTTIGNWSDGAALRQSPLPFTVTGYSGAARPLEGSVGYWGKMKDVFDPDFATNTDAALARLAADYRDNPLALGFFVDNEMSWSGIAQAALQSPTDQPARRVFIARLQEQYDDLAALNTAWATEADHWDALRMPTPPNRQCRDDCAAFEYHFARRYFDVVAAAVRAHAPNHLYLGCRFTPVYCPEPALRACAEVADVISLNMYTREMPQQRYHDLDKPVIIGEFHFGATDRGMFHTGLQAAADQEERAALYAAYLQSLALHPTIIGAHWFKYSDQPTTGRSLDGENYNIGLVSIADMPYPELIAAAKAIHQRMYAIRYDQPSP